MTVKTMYCPACSRPLPPEAKPNTLFTCPACDATLYLSDWEIGKGDGDVMVATPTRVYTVTDQIARDDLCNVYRCAYKLDDKQRQGMFRAARNAADNDLVKNEAQTVYHLQATTDYDDFRPFLPLMLDSFLYKDASLDKARQVNIFGLHEEINSPGELHSLQEVYDYYPNGIDPRDMAWMWRRVLYVLGFLHKQNVIHGAVLPSHILIEPVDHKVMLTGFGFSVREPQKTGDHIKALSITYEKWYPDEIRQKQPPTPSFDLFLAARTMLYIMGIDVLDHQPQHRNLDKKMADYFARCVHPNPRQRPNDAWALLKEFDGLIEGLWGPRTFRVFKMPYKR